MLLSKQAILRHLAEGTVVIDPFDERRLGTVSYDVTLGEWFFRRRPKGRSDSIFNPYSKTQVHRLWGDVQQAEPAQILMKELGIRKLSCIHPDQLVIWIDPHETLLCHTQEFIGGQRCVTGWMQGDSGHSRIFISVCKDAGLGDVGFVSRWTMEITNLDPEYTIPLPVGYKIAKIAFLETEPIEEEYRGSYQSAQTIEEIKASWIPEMMLPRLWNSREAREAEEIIGRLEAEAAAQRVIELLAGDERHVAKAVPDRVLEDVGRMPISEDDSSGD